MTLWTQSGVPHRGWQCVDVIDLRPTGQSVEDTMYAACEMCGNEPIRFVHIMQHEAYEEQLEVGCICAEKMSDDYVGPRQRETALKNKAARKAKWLSRKWRRSSRGNDFLNVEGFNLVVFPNKFKPGKWGYGIDGDFSRKVFDSKEEAKLALFEQFWELTQTSDC